MDVTVPTEIVRGSEGSLRITWSDGVERVYTAVELRAGCPCATCREKQRAKANEARAASAFKFPILTSAELQPLRIERMVPLGNYAYNVAFSDGHDSGIFTFDLLRILGQLQSG